MQDIRLKVTEVISKWCKKSLLSRFQANNYLLMVISIFFYIASNEHLHEWPPSLPPGWISGVCSPTPSCLGRPRFEMMTGSAGKPAGRVLLGHMTRVTWPSVGEANGVAALASSCSGKTFQQLASDCFRNICNVRHWWEPPAPPQPVPAASQP